jgi:hypothetical protein
MTGAMLDDALHRLRFPPPYLSQKSSPSHGTFFLRAAVIFMPESCFDDVVVGVQCLMGAKTQPLIKKAEA